MQQSFPTFIPLRLLVPVAMLSDSDYEEIASMMSDPMTPCEYCRDGVGDYVERLVDREQNVQVASHGILLTTKFLEQFGAVVSKTAYIEDASDSEAFDPGPDEVVVRMWFTEITHETAEVKEDVGDSIKHELEQRAEFDYADIESVEATETVERTQYTTK